MAALRSGEYKQTRGALSRGDEFCCLGVACEISGLGTWSESDSELAPRIFMTVSHADHMILPSGVMKYYGFSESNPTVRHNDRDYSLGGLNDRYVSFEEIAAIIEKNFLQDDNANQ